MYHITLISLDDSAMHVRNYDDGAKSVPHQIILTLHDDKVLQFEIIRQVFRKKTA